MDALSLLEKARAAGLSLRCEGDQLVVDGPKSAAEVVELLRQHKADILAVLRSPCCPACERRAGPPLNIEPGCSTHGVSTEDVARWWAVTEERDVTVSFCHCCGGPAPSEALTCRRCEAPACEP